MNTSAPTDTLNVTLYHFSFVCEITIEPLNVEGVKDRLKSDCTDATVNLSASSYERRGLILEHVKLGMPLFSAQRDDWRAKIAVNKVGLLVCVWDRCIYSVYGDGCFGVFWFLTPQIWMFTRAFQSHYMLSLEGLKWWLFLNGCIAISSSTVGLPVRKIDTEAEILIPYKLYWSSVSGTAVKTVSYVCRNVCVWYLE